MLRDPPRAAAPTRRSAVIPVAEDQTSAFGILKMDATGRIVHFDEKPPRDRLPGLVSELPGGGSGYLASMGIYIFRREVLEQARRQPPAGRLRPPRHPRRGPAPARAGLRLPRLLGGRRDDPVVLPGQPRAVRRDPALRFLRREAPGLHPPALPARLEAGGLQHPAAPSSPRAASCTAPRSSAPSSASAAASAPGSRIRNSLLIGADYYETLERDAAPPKRAASRPSASAPTRSSRTRSSTRTPASGRGVRIVNEAGVKENGRRRLLHPRRHRDRSQERHHRTAPSSTRASFSVVARARRVRVTACSASASSGVSHFASSKMIPAMQAGGRHAGRRDRVARRREGRRGGARARDPEGVRTRYEELLADPDDRRRLQSAAQPPARAVGRARGRRRKARAVSRSRSRWAPPRRGGCSPRATRTGC